MSMVVAITGANGFLGAACVAEARRHGLNVVAVTRSQPLAEWQADAGISHVRLDLTATNAADTLAEALPDHAALIHAAAHLGDDPARLARDTIAATETVLSVWRSRKPRLVLISSLAVYDTDAITPGATLTESSPLIPVPPRDLSGARDPYAGAKRLQEALMAEADPEDAWILRPGAIWGPGRTWHALQGFWASKLFVTIGSKGELPLAHVHHTARAAVEAARTFTEGCSVLNVFDDDRPTRARFLRVHRQVHGWPRVSLTVPYDAWASFARLLRPVSGALPGLFREPILRARLMPLRFPNTRLRHALGGADHRCFEDLMRDTKGSP